MLRLTHAIGNWKHLAGLLLALAVFTLALCPGICDSGASAGEDNLIYNGDFTIWDEDNLPDGWDADAYFLEPGYTAYGVQMEKDGSCAAWINNMALNDARLAQTIPVEPETLYRFSADIRADVEEEGHGANLSIEGLYAFSEELHDTEGSWVHVDWYGETGENQDYVTLFIRVGGYSGESRGKAWFKNVTLTEADAVPGDGIAARWYKEERSVAYDVDEEESEAPFGRNLTILLTVLWCTVCAFTLYTGRDAKKNDHRRWDSWIVPGLGLALALRILLSAISPGYGVDVGCFTSWGSTMASVGPAGFYTTTSYCDYPPAYLYILGLNGLLCRWMNAGEALTRIIYRLIPCLCDVTGCYMIYHFARKRGNPNRAGLTWGTLLLAFNPASILNSAVWGQMDSVLCLLLLIVALTAIRDQWQWTLPVYMLAVLVKPQALMLGFLGLIAFGQRWNQKPEVRKKMLRGLGIMMAVAVIVVTPFCFGQSFGWLIRLYGNTLASYPYATVNTANLYYLLGGNWSPVESAAHILSPVLLALGCVGYAAIWYKKARTRFGRIWIELALSAAFMIWFALCAVLGWGWNLVGIGAMAFAFVIVLSLQIRGRRMEMLPYTGALLFLLLYVFGIKMHERYWFPALLLLATGWGVTGDRRIAGLLILFTLTTAVNEGIVLDNSVRLGASLGHLNQDTEALADLLSVINVLGTFYGCRTGISLCLKEEPSQPRRLPTVFHIRATEAGPGPMLPYQPDRRLRWSIKDTVLLLAITVVYSVICLTTLGSAKAPQTAWSSSGDAEEVVFDLGDTDEPYMMLYFGRVSRYHFSLSVSNDLQHWSEDVYAEMDAGQCWKWKYATQSYEDASGKRIFFNSNLDNVLRFDARYVRLKSEQIGLTLCEVIFRTEKGKILPATIVSHTGANEDSELKSDPALMLDEQDTLEGLPRYFAVSDGEEELDIPQPCWWNSTYFDEIYHARTAFEFLNGSVPYETTHPPLGKLLMSACVAVFGMTPFGWRLAGALAGIAMLPAMYLLGKQLTKKTWAGAAACGLMALDCMHLTQTQIATIDSFPMLFTLFAYFFMLRFMQQNILTEKTKSLLVNLGLSGLFMGLAIASKWTGIYAGAGLGLLFFWHCFRHVRLCRQAEKCEESPFLQPYVQETKHGWKPDFAKITKLCAWCVLFFILVPLTIYVVCYVPYMAYHRGFESLWAYLKAVWDAQVGMLNYHSQPGLGMDHPFYSPWWEWPIIGKPMYYATKQYLVTEELAYSIFSFGNPVIWYGGLLGFIACIALWLRGKRYLIEENGIEKNGNRWHWLTDTGDQVSAFLLTGLLVQYLPWVLVPRGTYIYHYFASVPFLMLMIAVGLERLSCWKPVAARWTGAVLVALAVIAFVIFFPYASGVMCPVNWLDIGKALMPSFNGSGYRIWY